LKRDRYRCTISGSYDYKNRNQFPEIPDDIWKLKSTCTRANHIIPFRLGKLKKNAQVSPPSPTSRLL
jgi:hypothetical protein